MPKYLRPDEMSEIRHICVELNDLYESLKRREHVSLELFDGNLFPVYDANGDKLGDIGYTENMEFGLYLTETDND